MTQRAHGDVPAPDVEDLGGLGEALVGLREATQGSESWGEQRERALVGRILAATTREDLSWAGELRLVSTSLRERLRTSGPLRFVAASLLLHLVAGPVLAVLVLREEEQARTPRITFEPAVPAAPPAGEKTGAPALLLPVDGDAMRADAIWNSLRRARFVLERAHVPRPPDLKEQGGREGQAAPATGAATEIELLAGRSAYLWNGEWSARLDSARPAGPVARALLAEVLLDRYVLTGERSPNLSSTLSALALAERGGGLPAGEREAAAARLGKRALDRARAYGTWEAGPGFDPAAVPDPLDAAWIRDLRIALAGTEDRSGLTGAWTSLLPHAPASARTPRPPRPPHNGRDEAR